jgi:hypothetical protein
MAREEQIPTLLHCGNGLGATAFGQRPSGNDSENKKKPALKKNRL